MRKMTLICISFIVLLLLILAVAAQGASNKTGALEVNIEGVDIMHAQGSIMANDATAALEIKNVGSQPVRIALMRQFTLQLEGGASFDLATFNGLANCRDKQLKDCERMSDEFEVIPPGQDILVNLVFRRGGDGRDLGRGAYGRVSGTLFVRNQGTGKSWPANLSIKNIPVKRNL